MAPHARRRRIGGLLSATAASAASLASVFSTHTALAAAAGECDIEIPDIITYDTYDRLLQQRRRCERKAAEAAKQQAILDKYADQVLSGDCNGYIIPFVESVYVSLYGDAAVQDKWTTRVQNVFLRTMLEVLNECSDDCVLVDSVELELLEADTFRINDVFDGGNGRYLADLGDELYMAGDGETLTGTYLLANAANGTAAAAAAAAAIDEEGRQLQDSKRERTRDRRKRSRGKRNVAKIKARGRNSSGRKASLLSKRGKTSDVLGGNDRRHLEEADATECGDLLMERLAETGIDIFRCIANVELTSYNPIQCIDGKLIDSTTGNVVDDIGRSPQQVQGQSKVIKAQVEDGEDEIPMPRGRNRPRKD